MVYELIRHKLTYRQVQEAILSQKRVWLSKGTISEWAHGVHSPTGSINSFHSNPSPELAYVIGVVLGDGNLNIHGYNAEIYLGVTDYDFAKEFSRCLAKILSRKKLYQVRRSDRRNRWIVQGSSILLHRFLKSRWTNLKRCIEHCPKCEAALLRAFYDGEGCISGRSLTISNTKKQLLAYVQYRLEKLRIETLPLYVKTRAGTKLTDPKTGRTYFRRNDCFSFGIRTRSLPRFKQSVGFTIGRKQTALLDACMATKQNFSHA